MGEGPQLCRGHTQGHTFNFFVHACAIDTDNPIYYIITRNLIDDWFDKCRKGLVIWPEALSLC